MFPMEKLLRILACALAFATSCVEVVIVLGAEPHLPSGAEQWMAPFVALAALAPTYVGLLIALRQPRNPIAWILLVGAFFTSRAELLIPDHGWSLQVGRSIWPFLFVWPVAVALVFPNGRLLTRRWRWVAGIGLFCLVAFICVAMLDNEPFDSPFASVHNPMADVGHPSFLEWIWVPLWLGMLATLIASIVAIRLRLRRSTGVERLQTLWLAWSMSLIPIGLVISLCASWLVPFVDVVTYPLLLLMQTTVAVSIGVAVVRHRLYDIERLINRTLVYAALDRAVARLVHRRRSRRRRRARPRLGVGDRGGDACRRARVPPVAGARADDSSTGASIASAPRACESCRPSRTRCARACARPRRSAPCSPQALRDPLAELVFWLPASETYATAAGELVAALPDDGRARSEITREGARTAVLLHDPALLERRISLREILAAAALSVEIARLRVEVRLQLQEVQASRVRIVEAGYEERRRLERDLHDGAQQRLVSLGLQIRRMQRSLPREASVLAPALDQIVGEVGSAIADLRQIAAGVRPARLDDGLAAALHDLARTAPIPVEVEAPIGRVAASVEAAAYFVVCEAITNAVKHSSASRIELRATRENGALLLSVADDGVGGARARRGSGLAGLDDRVSAHGGTLEIASPRGGGTRIEVAIPCDS